MLTTREKYILGIYAQRATRGVIYAPNHVTISGVKGQMKSQELFDTPFSHNLVYRISNGSNNTMKSISMKISIQ